ncbi:MAG TPA: hypothetical protein VN901_17830 [Candidatus Acidoferrales bacterium]|nr:hypothetical protein [Candidatus Acidoferrales bacterium]
MSVPMRKEKFEDENLTTADLAQGKRPAASHDLLKDGPNADRPSAEDVISDHAINDRTINDRSINDRSINDRNINDRNINDRAVNDRPGPVLAERPAGEVAQNAVSEVRSASETRSAPDTAPLFPATELEELRNSWSGVQTAFVDEPRRAVEQADGLVASAMKRLAEVFAEERSKLEQQWDRGDNVSTEDLRIALQRYRSFFHRLLSI